MQTLLEWFRLNTSHLNLSDSNIEWKLFVKDHRKQLIATATTHVLSADEIELFRFRPNEYLNSINLTEDLTWIVLWLNQLNSPENFYNIRELIIPNYAYVNSLRETYRSVKSNLDKASI